MNGMGQVCVPDEICRPAPLAGSSMQSWSSVGTMYSSLLGPALHAASSMCTSEQPCVLAHHAFWSWPHLWTTWSTWTGPGPACCLQCLLASVPCAMYGTCFQSKTQGQYDGWEDRAPEAVFSLWTISLTPWIITAEIHCPASLPRSYIPSPVHNSPRCPHCTDKALFVRE